MKIQSIFSALAICVSLVSCAPLTTTESALQVLMGKDSQELIMALGKPVAVNGSLSNGRLEWSNSYMLGTPDYNDYGPTEDNFSCTLVATTSQNNIRSIHYVGNASIVKEAWTAKNAALLNLNMACARDDLATVSQLLSYNSSLTQRDVIMQAAAQAARYQASSVLQYLISTYQLDINEPIQTWKDLADWEDNLILINTSIAQLMRTPQP